MVEPKPGTGTESRASVTALLAAHRDGDGQAFDRLVELVYDELRGMAHAQLRRGRRDPDLQTTALVSELYLKLAGREHGWRDRGHFFAACATAIRHILVDAARHRLRAKREAGAQVMPLDESVVGDEGDPAWVLQLDQLLRTLAEHDPRLVRVFECRYFAGYSSQETATALDLSLRTAQRDWERAQIWMRSELAADGPATAPGK